MKFLIYLILLFCSSQYLYSQTKQDSCYKERYFVGLTSPNIDNSVYTTMQNIWYANEKVSYLCPLPIYKNLVSPKIPLRDGEGVNGYLFEGSVYHQATIAMGRNHARHKYQTQRVTFDYGFNIRMAKDSSNPLIPNNNIFGFTYEKILWNSYTKNPSSDESWKKYAFEDWTNQGKSLSNISLNVTTHHYSNGQPPGFFIKKVINGILQQRNDYLQGDFSTNYLQIGLTYSNLSVERNLFSFKLAYQRDGNVFGPLRYSPEQKFSFGQNRLMGFAQYRLNWRKRNSLPATIESTCDKCNPTKTVYINRSSELVFRMDYEYILGNLKNYPFDSKYRLNTHFYIHYSRPSWRALGFVAHYFYGRDYSNIRYDLPISIFMVGMNLNFNKFRPPFTDKQKFIFAN